MLYPNRANNLVGIRNALKESTIFLDYCMHEIQLVRSGDFIRLQRLGIMKTDVENEMP